MRCLGSPRDWPGHVLPGRTRSVGSSLNVRNERPIQGALAYFIAALPVTWSGPGFFVAIGHLRKGPLMAGPCLHSELCTYGISRLAVRTTITVHAPA